MNETLRRAITAAVVLIVVFALGLGAGYLARGGELDQVKNDLRAATLRNIELGKELQAARGAAAGLEEIAEQRRREIAGLRDEVTALIGAARVRDEIIAGFEAELNSIGGSTKTLSRLAQEGRSIVERRLAALETRED